MSAEQDETCAPSVGRTRRGKHSRGDLGSHIVQAVASPRKALKVIDCMNINWHEMSAIERQKRIDAADRFVKSDKGTRIVCTLKFLVARRFKSGNKVGLAHYAPSKHVPSKKRMARLVCNDRGR